VKLGAVKEVISLRALVKLYHYFPHSLFDLGDIKYEKFARNVLLVIAFVRIVPREGHKLVMGVTKDTFMCGLKTRGIL
jgi:hypothetical protein